MWKELNKTLYNNTCRMRLFVLKKKKKSRDACKHTDRCLERRHYMWDTSLFLLPLHPLNIFPNTLHLGPLFLVMVSWLKTVICLKTLPWFPWYLSSWPSIYQTLKTEYDELSFGALSSISIWNESSLEMICWQESELCSLPERRRER